VKFIIFIVAENKLHVGLPFSTKLTGLVSGCLSQILVKRSLMPLVGVRTLRLFGRCLRIRLIKVPYPDVHSI